MSDLTTPAEGSLVAARLTGHPSFVVEVSGIEPDFPVSDLQKLWSAGKGEGSVVLGDADILRVDRSAIVKFKRHSEVQCL